MKNTNKIYNMPEELAKEIWNYVYKNVPVGQYLFGNNPGLSDIYKSSDLSYLDKVKGLYQIEFFRFTLNREFGREEFFDEVCFIESNKSNALEELTTEIWNHVYKNVPMGSYIFDKHPNLVNLLKNSDLSYLDKVKGLYEIEFLRFTIDQRFSERDCFVELFGEVVYDVGGDM